MSRIHRTGPLAQRGPVGIVLFISLGMLAFAAPSSATLIDNGNSMIDDVSNLEWLDLTLTKDLSPSDALLLPAAAGYAVALDSQVAQLFANAGFVQPLVTGSIAADFDEAGDMLSFLGCTITCGGNFPQGRGFAERAASPGNYVRPFYTQALVTSFGDAVIVSGFNNGAAGVTDNGVFLVRVVPEPGTALLFGLGLAGLAARRRG
jgi:hypothetical protein